MSPKAYYPNNPGRHRFVRSQVFFYFFFSILEIKGHKVSYEVMELVIQFGLVLERNDSHNNQREQFRS